MSDSLKPHGLQHTRPPCPSPSPGVCSNSCPWISDAIQPSHPLSSPSPPAFNISQYQGLFQWVGSLNQVTIKYWSFSFSIRPSSEYSGLISYRTNWFDLLAVQGTLNSLQQDSLKDQFFSTQYSLWFNSHICTWLLEKPYLWLDRPLLVKWCLCFLIHCLGWS